MFKFKQRKAWSAKRKWAVIAGTATVVLSMGAALWSQVGFNIKADLPVQTVLEDPKLNVTGTAQRSGNTTTWELDIKRADITTAQTATIAYDMNKAGLTQPVVLVNGVEAKLTDNSVVVDFKQNEATAKVSLTADTSLANTADITLPLSFSLINAGDATNQLDVKAGNLVLQKAGLVSEEKSVKLSPNADANGIIGPTVEEPAITYQRLAPLAVDAQIDPTNPDSPVNLIKTNFVTTPKYDGTTNPANFQIWVSSTPQPSTVLPTAGNVSSLNGVQITPKFDMTDANLADIGGQEDNVPANITKVRTKYHSQYFNGVANPSNPNDYKNRSSYIVTFDSDEAMGSAKIDVLYDRVGEYTDNDGKVHTVGAIMTLTPSVASSNEHMGNLRYIDVPNSLYSGIQYHGMDSVDVHLQFYETTYADDAAGNSVGTFTNTLDIENGQLTFGSLNNFGVPGYTNGWDANGGNSWLTTNTGIHNYQNAETVDPLTKGVVNMDLKPILADQTLMEENTNAGTTGKRYYATGHGLDSATADAGTTNWRDFLGDNTFERASIGWPISGTDYAFRMYSGTDNTWQTFTAGVNTPKALNPPVKAVDAQGLSSTTVAGHIYPDGSKHGNYDKLDFANISGVATQTIDGLSYYDFSYYIRQQTYILGTDSIAKPYTMYMADTLPLGVVMQNTKATDSSISDPTVLNTLQDDVVVHTTDDTILPRVDATTGNANYMVTLVPSAQAGQQDVQVLFTESGMNNIDFDGNSIQIELKTMVRTDYADANGLSLATFTNQADWYTQLWVAEEDNFDKKTTNTVVNYEHPKTTSLTVTKVDALSKDKLDLATATFQLLIDGVAATNPADYMTISGSDIQLTNLTPDHTYALVETKAPTGYYVNPDKNTYSFRVVWDAEAGTFSITVPDDSADWLGVPAGNTADGFTATIGNARQPVHFNVTKLDGDGDDLSGATFSFLDMTDTSATPIDMVVNSNGYLSEQNKSMGDAYNLKFDTTYKVTETKTPAGYTTIDPFYFKVTWDTDKFAPVFQYVNADGTAITGADAITVATATDGNDIPGWVGQLTADNHAQSIFPVTGGMGVSALVTAALTLIVLSLIGYFIRRKMMH